MTDLKILIDSREKRPFKLKNYLNSRNILFEVRTLQSGDYSFELDNISYTDKFIVEKKSGKVGNGGGYAELRGNILQHHNRFKAEFKRLKRVDAVFLVIENADSGSWRDIRIRKGMRITNKNFKISLNTFLRFRNYERSLINRNPINVIHIPADLFGPTLLKLIADYLKTDISQLSS